MLHTRRSECGKFDINFDDYAVVTPYQERPGVAIGPHMARTVPGTHRLCCTIAAGQINASPPWRRAVEPRSPMMVVLRS
jgi:hypothetical protein